MRGPVLPRPFPHAHLESWTDAQWRQVAAVVVPTRCLVPSQEAVSLVALARLVNGGEPEGGDGVYGRAVRWCGDLFLFDGHTRWVMALLVGQPLFWVRVVDV